MSGVNASKATALIVVAVLAVFAPMLLHGFQLTMLTNILIFGLFVASLDLLVGYAGLISLGHAAFFGIGGYTAAVLDLQGITTNVIIVLIVACVITAAIAWCISWVALAAQGVGFIMLTLAIGELSRVAIESVPKVSGGTQGVAAPGKSLLSVGAGDVSLSAPDAFYWYVLVVVAICCAAIWVISRSPFGLALQGIRENPERMRALGHWVKGYQSVIFMIAGGFAGISGVLSAQHVRYISPDTMGFLISALVLVMLTIGGKRSLIGAFVGAAIVLLIRDELSSALKHWELILGVVFIVFMYFIPNGLSGLWRGLWMRMRRRSAQVDLQVGES